MERFYAVTVFNRYNPKEKRTVVVEACSADEAENLAVSGGLTCREEGWFVEGSRAVFEKGDLVKWNDPAISDYDKEDREAVLNRTFEVVSEYIEGEDDGEIIEISEVGGGSYAEVPAHELELIEDSETPLCIEATISKSDIKKAEQILIDNGIEADEAETVLQAIGYALLGTELYEN